MKIKVENSNFKVLSLENKFDAVICLDADLPEKDFFLRISGIPLLAADGAAIKLYNMGIVPDFVIGDLDSFNQSGITKNFKPESIIYYPEQDTNDFEKVLTFSLKNFYKNILILGFHGGELEHTLNNWSVLMKYATKLNLMIFDKGRIGIPVNHSIRFKAKIGEMISIIPEPTVTLTTKNLRWNLEHEKLELGFREGARNIAESDIIEIELHEGSYLLFIDERIGDCLNH
jgi:thiamine pyrophosphokinase